MTQTNNSSNTFDLNSLPGRATVSWQSVETPEEIAHRLQTERREHINYIAFGWFVGFLVFGLASAAAYAAVTSATDGARAGAWAVVVAAITAVPSFFAGRWSSK
jgi:hypothetical protein